MDSRRSKSLPVKRPAMAPPTRPPIKPNVNPSYRSDVTCELYIYAKIPKPNAAAAVSAKMMRLNHLLV
jgi:hypothetical protein